MTTLLVKIPLSNERFIINTSKVPTNTETLNNNLTYYLLVIYNITLLFCKLI